MPPAPTRARTHPPVPRRGGTAAARRPGSARRPRARRGAAWGAVALVGAAVVGVVLAVRPGRTGGPASPVCTVATTVGRWQLDPAQAQNAAIIAAVGHRLGMPDHAVTVAVTTALQESHLHDLTYGDRDSVGLFQQRPSQGWGTRTEILDPAYAAAAFYTHLRKVPGWDTLPVTEAAQAVQLSAAPTAYASHEAEGRAIAVAVTGEEPAALTCHAAAFEGAAPAPGALADAATAQFGAPVLAVALPEQLAWQVAAWAVAHAAAYHV
ncbi:MAG TPA: hypothetical protein VFP61_11540, partial [Acidimicrobiales bacterium]|nr:hypothetical protein [Acidimicrobiales bacterium]